MHDAEASSTEARAREALREIKQRLEAQVFNPTGVYLSPPPTDYEIYSIVVRGLCETAIADSCRSGCARRA
jgi:hypothetical protein